MKYSDEMRRIIMDCDAEAAVKLHEHLFPHLPKPESVREARATIHLARTAMSSVPSKLRCYSHAWLRDEGLPSALPDHLKKKADRLYPVGARAVGIAVKYSSPRSLAIRSVMETAVLETYADGHSDEPQIVKARMLEKRAEFIRRS